MRVNQTLWQQMNRDKENRTGRRAKLAQSPTQQTQTQIKRDSNRVEA